MSELQPTAAGASSVDNLLADCAAGDAAALRRIYALLAPRLYAVALRLLRDRATADDVLQETFLQVWSKASHYDADRGRGEVWIMSLLRYRALDVLRSRKRESLTDDPNLGDTIEPPVAFELVSAAQDSAALHHCLDALEETNRRCILLAYVEGYSHSEIAGRLSAPLGTVKAWIRRGLISLRTCLSS